MKNTIPRAILAASLAATMTSPMIARGAPALNGNAALVQDSATPDVAPALAPEPGLEVELTGGVWVPRLGGDATLGPAGGRLGFETNLRMNSSEATPSVELTLSRDDYWLHRLSGFDFETTDSGVFAGTATFGALTLTPGDPWHGEVRMTSMAMEVGARVWRPFRPTPEHPDDPEVSLLPVFGARYVNVDQVVERIGGLRESAEGDWLALTVGFELHLRWSTEHDLPFVRAIEMRAGAAAGPALGGDGGSIWQVRAGFAMELSEQVELYFGYRLLELDVENDDFEFDAGLQGLFVGASLRF